MREGIYYKVEKGAKMKKYRVLVFLAGLACVCLAILYVPAFRVQAVYPEQSAVFHFSAHDGLVFRSVTKGEIVFSASADRAALGLSLLLAAAATLFSSLKRGRLAGALLYVAALLFLATVLSASVSSQEMQGAAHEESHGPSLFLLVHAAVFLAVWAVQGLLLRRERAHLAAERERQAAR